MKSIILARVSTEDQKEAGNSLPTQIKRLKDYCKRKDLEVIKKFSFDESAYKTKRDKFDRILEYPKGNKVKIAVCFDKVDYFSRAPGDAPQLDTVFAIRKFLRE
ncbi:MAG: recombinase family protein [Candidatus Berkelbacteria bacterium]